MATPDEVQLQKGALTTAQTEQTGSAKAVSLIESLAAGVPSLPKGTTISPQLQNVATTELMATPGVTGTLAAAVPTAPTAPTI